jgi:prepilin-type processing-associated H-X9-DG protein
LTGCTSWSQVSDGTSNTIAVVEVAGSGINWMEPRDLPLEVLCGENPTTATLTAHPKGPNASGAMVVFCDGHTSFLEKGTPLATLKALATRAGGEAIVGDY